MTQAPEYAFVGQRVRPANAVAKGTGAHKYTADINLPGMLWVKVVRSPHARARIRAIHTEEARALPGVAAVLTYQDVPDRLWGANPAATQEGERIFSDQVNFVGEAVAAVAAEDLDVLEEAANRIRVEYEPLPMVLDPEQGARPEAVQLHAYGNVVQGAPGQPSGQNKRGDVARGFAEADVVVERTYRQLSVHGVPHEPRGAVAQWDGQRLTVWQSTQQPFMIRNGLAAVLGLAQDQVRVIATNAGGGFGIKNSPSLEGAIVGLVAMQTGRPAKIWYTREEETLDGHVRPGFVHYVKAGVTRDGRITAVQVRSYGDNGYWGGNTDGATGIAIPRDMCVNVMELYNKIANVDWEVYLVRTNHPRAGAYRARGTGEAIFAIECMMEDLASAIGADPCELRLRHAIRTGDQANILKARGFADTKPVTIVAFPDCLAEGQRAIGWERRNREPGSAAGPIKRGIGMAGAIHVAGSTPSLVAECRLTIDAAGGIRLANGHPDQGSELQTTLKQIVAETLRMPMSAISTINADTDECPFDVGPISSGGAFRTGTAAFRATEAAKARAISLAAEMLDQPEGALAIADGQIWLEATNEPLATLAEVAAFAGGTIVGEGRYVGKDEPVYTYGFAGTFAEVDVDVETGGIDVRRLVCAVDVGRALNPEIVEGQIEGGVAQGFGTAMGEGMHYDPRSGATLNQWFLDLKTPTTKDMPRVEAILIEKGNEGHPFGAKGCSEIPLVGVAPAIRNAVFNATGVHVDEIPMTPDRVLAAIAQEATGANGGRAP
jgi:CO/xanthine dehydrogenase Mo-binding subunit